MLMLAPDLSVSEVLRGSGYISSWSSVPAAQRERMEWAAGAVFQPLRQAWGHPLRVVEGGGLRTWDVHEAIYREKHHLPPKASRHLFGDAFDLKLGAALAAEAPWRLVDLYDLAASMQKSGELPAGGLSIYLHPDGRFRFAHVDGRGTRARWGAKRLARARVLHAQLRRAA